MEGIENAVPALVGGGGCIVGGKLGVAAMAMKGLPPVQKAVLAVGTAVVGGFGVTFGAGLAKNALKRVSSSTNLPESSGSSCVNKYREEVV